MRESHSEGIASHTGPELCVDVRKDGYEALTGVCAGWVLSRENDIDYGTPTLSEKAEGNIQRNDTRDTPESCAVRDPKHAQKRLIREPGYPVTAVTGRVRKSKDTR